MKFGGSSIGEAERILNVGRIVQERIARRPLVVVSALGGVTDLLLAAVSAARGDDLDALDPLLADIERRHRWALGGCIDDSRARHALSLEIDRGFEQLRQRLRSIRILGEGTPRAIDSILATGELLSSRIVAAAFRGLGLNAKYVDAREVLRTDGRFGDAEPDLPSTAERCRATLGPWLEQGVVPVLGGFVGATSEGETTTLGRGGSDTSAAVLGAALQVEEIQIWTDVDGLMSADPRLVPGARTIPRVSFAEAAELAFYGARVLHPDSLAPAVERQIPVRVLNAGRPDRPGSVILDAEPDTPPARLVSVASRGEVWSVRIVSHRLRADAAFLERVLRAAREAEIVPDLVVASEVAVHLVIPPGDAEEAVAQALAECGRVEVAPERAIVCVIGGGLARKGQERRTTLAALAEWNPELLVAGVTASGLVAVLPMERLEPAVRGLHERFFESRGVS